MEQQGDQAPDRPSVGVEHVHVQLDDNSDSEFDENGYDPDLEFDENGDDSDSEYDENGGEDIDAADDQTFLARAFLAHALQSNDIPYTSDDSGSWVTDLEDDLPDLPDALADGYTSESSPGIGAPLFMGKDCGTGFTVVESDKTQSIETRGRIQHFQACDSCSTVATGVVSLHDSASQSRSISMFQTQVEEKPQQVGSLPCRKFPLSTAWGCDGALGISVGEELMEIWKQCTGDNGETVANNMAFNRTQYLSIPDSPNSTPAFSLGTLYYSVGTSMLNCVRFGRVGNRDRVIISCQSRWVYLLETGTKTPTQSEDTPDGKLIPVTEFLCKKMWTGHENGANDYIHNTVDRVILAKQNEPQLRSICLYEQFLRYFLEQVQGLNPRHQRIVENQLVPARFFEQTVAIGPFDFEVNCADASPDGRWLAVVGDSQRVMLLSAVLNYSPRLAIRLKATAPDGKGCKGDRHTCQYLAWSTDSQFLAVSSDSHNAVDVWRISYPNPDLWEPERMQKEFHDYAMAEDDATCVHADNKSMIATVLQSLVQVQKVASFVNHIHPCLQLRFMPLMPSVLMYAEEAHLLHIVDVRLPKEFRQVLAYGEGFTQDSITQEDIRRIQGVYTNRIRTTSEKRLRPNQAIGLCMPSSDAVVVATQNHLMTLKVVHGWSRELHHNWPKKFREAVRLLLLVQKFGTSGVHSPDEGSASTSAQRRPGLSCLHLSSLPSGVMDIIISLAAATRDAWM